MRLLVKLVKVTIAVLVFESVRQQLSRPPTQRTWHGRVGPVPYDYRWPTFEQVRAAMWNPDDDRLFTGKVLGLGWSINFAQALKIANELRRQSREMVAKA